MNFHHHNNHPLFIVHWIGRRRSNANDSRQIRAYALFTNRSLDAMHFQLDKQASVEASNAFCVRVRIGPVENPSAETNPRSVAFSRSIRQRLRTIASNTTHQLTITDPGRKRGNHGPGTHTNIPQAHNPKCELRTTNYELRNGKRETENEKREIVNGMRSFAQIPRKIQLSYKQIFLSLGYVPIEKIAI